MASYENARHVHFNFLPYQTKFLNFEIISPLRNSETKHTTHKKTHNEIWLGFHTQVDIKAKKNYKYLSLNMLG